MYRRPEPSEESNVQSDADSAVSFVEVVLVMCVAHVVNVLLHTVGVQASEGRGRVNGESAVVEVVGAVCGSGQRTTEGDLVRLMKKRFIDYRIAYRQRLLSVLPHIRDPT